MKKHFNKLLVMTAEEENVLKRVLHAIFMEKDIKLKNFIQKNLKIKKQKTFQSEIIVI